jgi:leader peptidase (prepilin peptidase)/N-methyltransferase
MNGLVTPIFLSFLGVCFGAAAGSFVNVLIHRVPRLIDASEGQVSVWGYISGLAWPPSRCATCDHALGWRDNIPIVSYLVLRGRCRFCHDGYGVRHLAVEIFSAAAFAYCMVAFGLTAKAYLAAGFLAALVALSAIDIEEQLLPDVVLAPLFCLGLVFHALYAGGLTDAGLGAAAGYGILWLIREAYRIYSGGEGMGYGDVKFAAVLGVWLGLAAVPAALFLAFAGGSALMLPLTLFGRVGERAPVPFGPFLAFGGFCAFVLPGLASLTASVLPA